MHDESLLRDKARAAIRNKKLATRQQDLMLGAHGSGSACTLCGELIPHDQAELEAQFNQPSIPPGLTIYHFHPRCFAAWDFERTKIPAASS